ncbi:WD40 domain-containing protein [Tubulinosema ratisbonensis]|uniref:WD40 domain-containing protein n=1 Tax=Tubulinosema ratisbonensis TaxID=291195 RepID=A0A437AN83_9MICR|nr:WD40 domain-containing protein [Tubulinosema ratisbonensis]
MLSSIDFLSDDFTLKALETDQIDEDSSIEDEEILLTDKVIVSTYPSDETNSLLFYVYSSEYFYPHHEVSYPSLFFDCKVLEDNFVAVSSLSKDVLVFDPKIKNLDTFTYSLKGHQSNVLCLDYTDSLISGSEDKSIIFWDNLKIKERIQTNDEIVKLSVCNKLIAYLSNDKLVLRSNEEILKEIKLKEIEDIKLTPTKLFYSQGEGNLFVLDLVNYTQSSFKIHNEVINTIDFYNDWIVTGSEDKTVKVFDWVNNKLIRSFKVSDSVTKLKMNEGVCFYGGEDTELSYLNFKNACLKENQ